MSNAFVGEIRMFGFNFPPRGWAFCAGQTMSISQNTALFALLGTTYGGNGQTTFNLPDLRGRVPVNAGNGPGLSPYSLGEATGVENVSLLESQMPQHTHSAVGTSATASTGRVGGSVPAHASSSIYGSAPDGTTMNAGMIGATGGSQPFSVLQPLLTVNFCIALVGIFPSRN